LLRKQDMLRFDPRSEDDAVTLLSTCTPGDYERELRVALDPMPWALLYPVHVQATPLVVTTTTDLLQVAVDCFAQRRCVRRTAIKKLRIVILRFGTSKRMAIE
jgi:hypothetical protein